ncbi:MAG: glycosyltransferase family 4 protein [Candidatus Aminicenantes bacterium]
MPGLKRLLFLNRSFYPDVEATGQLLTELCEELADDFEVHVICGNPLYRKVKSRKLVHKSRYQNINIWRINNTTLPKRYFLTRVINLLSYYILCFVWTFFLKRMDCVISETDPPLLASIAYVYSRIHRSGFVYYSQDIWPDVGMVNQRMTNPVLTAMLRAGNRFLYKNATTIVVPGRDMKERLRQRTQVPPHKIEVVENWADPGQIYPVDREKNDFVRKHSLRDKFVVMYSGNLGLSQDLEKIIYTAGSLREFKDILFVLVGEGASKEKLLNLADSLNLKNVKFLTYQEKEDLKFSLNAAHIHLVTLKKGMKGIIVPSKVYGIMAAGRPFLAAVDEGSEIDKMVREFGCGMAVPPSDVRELRKALLWASDHRDEIEKMGKRGRKALEDHYTRKICAQKFRNAIKNCGIKV